MHLACACEIGRNGGLPQAQRKLSQQAGADVETKVPSTKLDWRPSVSAITNGCDSTYYRAGLWLLLNEGGMPEFAVLTNRKRALIALVHSVAFLLLALRGFASPKTGVSLHAG